MQYERIIVEAGFCGARGFVTQWFMMAFSQTPCMGLSPAVAGFSLFSFLSQQAKLQLAFVFVIRLLIYII